MSKYSNYSTKQLLTILENRGFKHRNGDLYDDEVIEMWVDNRVITNYNRSDLISYLDEYDAIYVHTIKTYNRFYNVYNFHRIKHGESI